VRRLLLLMGMQGTDHLRPSLPIASSHASPTTDPSTIPTLMHTSVSDTILAQGTGQQGERSRSVGGNRTGAVGARLVGRGHTIGIHRNCHTYIQSEGTNQRRILIRCVPRVSLSYHPIIRAPIRTTRI
jgi:hypothetical protein